MIIASRKFKAVFSALNMQWEIQTTSETLHFWTKYLRVKEGNQETSPKNNFQIIEAENAELLFEGSYLVLQKYTNLEKTSLWKDLFNPDQPRNLAKSVTVI